MLVYRNHNIFSVYSFDLNSKSNYLFLAITSYLGKLLEVKNEQNKLS